MGRGVSYCYLCVFLTLEGFTVDRNNLKFVSFIDKVVLAYLQNKSDLAQPETLRWSHQVLLIHLFFRIHN